MTLSLRIVFVGNSTVGKTSILKQLIEYQYQDDVPATVGIDFFTKIINCRDHYIKMNIWDTAGQERFAKIVSSYFRGVDGYVIVFALDDYESFLNVTKWFQIILSINPLARDAVYIIVGNKCDLSSIGTISETLIMQSIDHWKTLYPYLIYLETSAKYNYNLSLILDHIGQLYLTHKLINQDSTLHEQPTIRKKESCCFLPTM